MPILGGGKKPKKQSRKKRLQGAFDVPLVPTARERLAEKKEAAKDALIAKVAREKRKEAERAALVEKADALKEKALERRQRDAEADAAKRSAQDAVRRERDEQRTACTCRKPTVDKNGKCVRCKKIPAGKRRR